jgi:hypothetical protein
MAGEQGVVTQLTVLQGDKLARFTGRRREDDINYHEGPSIEVYIASIETFCSANNITTSPKKYEVFKLNLHPSVGDARETAHKYDTLCALCGVDPNSYEEIVKQFRKNYQSNTELSLRTAAADLLALEILPVNSAIGRNHSRLFSKIKNFVNLFFSRPKYVPEDDERSHKAVVVDALYYLMMSPRLTEGVYNKALRDVDASMNTMALTDAVLDKVGTLPGKTDAYEPRQIMAQVYSIEEVLSASVDAADPDVAGDPFQINNILQEGGYFDRKAVRGAHRSPRGGRGSQRGRLPRQRGGGQGHRATRVNQVGEAEPGEAGSSNMELVPYEERDGEFEYDDEVNAVQTEKRCYRCKATGHFVSDCKVRPSNECFKCGKQGHFAARCTARGARSNSFQADSQSTKPS